MQNAESSESELAEDSDTDVGMEIGSKQKTFIYALLVNAATYKLKFEDISNIFEDIYVIG